VPFDYELSQAEIQLIDLLSAFPNEVQRAAHELKPLDIASIAYDLAKAFSDFYNVCPVLQADEACVTLACALLRQLAR